MNYYISDLHIHHKNVIRFDNRPFADTDLMNAVLVNNWNERVTEDDHESRRKLYAFPMAESTHCHHSAVRETGRFNRLESKIKKPLLKSDPQNRIFLKNDPHLGLEKRI